MEQVSQNSSNRLLKFLIFFILIINSYSKIQSQTFSPPLNLDPISSGEQQLQGRKMIATLADSVYVVYEHVYQNGGNYYSEIYLKKSSDRGVTFSAPVTIVNITGAFQYGPSVCVDNVGNIYVSWTRFLNETSTEIYFTKSIDGGQSFINSTLIANMAFETDIVVHNSNVYIMYMKSTTGQDADYYLVKSTDGGNTFQAPVQINDSPCIANLGIEAMFSLAINPIDGVLHAVWVDGRRAGGNGDIYYAKSIDEGATFSTNIPVNDQNSPYADLKHYYPTIAINNIGKAFVVWQEKKEISGVQYFQRIMFARENIQGNTFEPQKALTDTFFSQARHPYIDISDNGLIGVTYSLGGIQILLSRNDGATFEERITVTDASANDPKYGMLSIDNLESANILFRDSRSGLAEVYFTKGSVIPTDGKALVNDIAKLYLHNTQGSFQWQNSSDGITFNDIPGATTNPYSLTLIASPSGYWYYRAKITDPLCVNQPVTYSTISTLKMIANTTQLNAGDKFHGGKVFISDGSGNGLIAPEYDQSDSVKWGCFGSFLPNVNSTTDGQLNTTNILTGCLERPIAASICDSSTVEGYSDWFLHAIQQLDTLVKQYQFFTNYDTGNYWSSTQSLNTSAEIRNFSNPNIVMAEEKHVSLNVRCIRAYSGTDNNKTIHVHVYALNQPVAVNITSQPSLVNGCKGSQIEIAFNSVGSNTSYQWKKNGVDIPGENSNVLSFNNADVSLEGIYTCELSNFCNTIETGNIQLQVIDINLSAGINTSICAGDTANFHAIAQSNYPGSSGNISFQWSPSLGLSSVNTAITDAFPFNSTVYTVTATDEIGCVQTDSLLVNVGHVYQNESICLVTVDTITWKNKIQWEKTNGVGTDRIKIYKENGVNSYAEIGTSNFSQLSEFIDFTSVPESHGDKYKISLIDTCGNESSKSPFHKTMNLTIAAFGSTMGLNWDDYVDESGVYVPFRYYIYRGTSPTNMTIIDSVSGSFNSYNDVNVFNVYYYLIGVKKTGGCNITRSADFMSYSNKKDNIEFIGINEVSYGTIKVSPNPFSDFTTITIPNFNQSFAKSQLLVTDVTGKVVRMITNPFRHCEGGTTEAISSSQNQIASNPAGSRNDAQIVIERGNLKPGVYFIEIKSDRTYRGKLVVE